MVSRFCVNGLRFESDFHAALYIVLQSPELDAESFFRRALEEHAAQQKDAWKAGALRDESLQRAAASLSAREPPRCARCGQLAVRSSFRVERCELAQLFRCSEPGCGDAVAHTARAALPGSADSVVAPDIAPEIASDAAPDIAPDAAPDAGCEAAPATEAAAADAEFLAFIRTFLRENAHYPRGRRVCTRCGVAGFAWTHDALVLYVCLNDTCESHRPNDVMRQIIGWDAAADL